MAFALRKTHTAGSDSAQVAAAWLLGIAWNESLFRGKQGTLGRAAAGRGGCRAGETESRERQVPLCGQLQSQGGGKLAMYKGRRLCVARGLCVCHSGFWRAC